MNLAQTPQVRRGMFLLKFALNLRHFYPFREDILVALFLLWWVVNHLQQNGSGGRPQVRAVYVEVIGEVGT